MRCAIVGAGVSGLVSARWAIEYGVEPVIFEMNNSIAGLWDYSPETSKVSVLRSTVMNTSKEMSAFSDFPPPDHFPPFMSHRHMLQYIEAYVERHQLKKYILFGVKVIGIRRSKDYAINGNWQVEYVMDGCTNVETFDCCLLAQGYNMKPRYPEASNSSWPQSLEKFQGKVVHSHEYREPKGLYDDSVNVVVGIGNTAADIAVELSSVSKQVYISTRRGAWIVGRLGRGGMPIDMQSTTRFNSTCLPKLLPRSLIDWLTVRRIQSRFDHEKYGLMPAHGITSQQATVHDALPERIICGAIVVKPNIASFTSSGIIWEDGSRTEHIDNVILCTGYERDFNIVERGELVQPESMYKFMFPVTLLKDEDVGDHSSRSDVQSFAIIGLVHATGAITPIVEMQSRLFFAQFCGHIRVKVSRSKAIEELQSMERERLRRYVNSPRYAFQINHTKYMDDLASMVGCCPSVIDTLLLPNLKLAYHLMFNGNLPYAYRLQGPHCWAGAREAIVGAEMRIERGLKFRETSDYEFAYVGQRISAAAFCLIIVLLVVLFV